MSTKSIEYSMKLGGLSKDDVTVVSFSGREKIARPFSYEVDLLYEKPNLDTSSIIYKPATLKITLEGFEDHLIHGYISFLEQRVEYEQTYLRVELVPRLSQLRYTKQNAVYQNMNLEELIKLMVSKSDIVKDTSYEHTISHRIDLKNKPKLEYVVQYQETNLQFLHRRLEHFGVSYYFEHSDSEETVVFTDKHNFPDAQYTKGLNYGRGNRNTAEPDPTITDWICQEKLIAGKYCIRDYDPDSDDTNEANASLDSMPGLQYEYGDYYDEAKEGKRLVGIRKEEMVCQQKVFSGSGDMHIFRAGQAFKTGDRFPAAWKKKDYLITELYVHGDQRSKASHASSEDDHAPIVPFRNSFKAIPKDVIFRPRRITPIPRIPGVMSAIVESNSKDDKYAYLDEKGRYKVRMSFDRLNYKNTGDSSVAIRQVQPYSGEKYGMHFPNHAGTEMVFACMDGDPDRPISLGTVPHLNTKSPVDKSTRTKSTFRSSRNNELTFDDNNDQEEIYLRGQKDWRTEINNDKKQDIGNNEVLNVATNRTKTVGKDQTETISRNKTITVEGNHDETIHQDRTLHIMGGDTITIDGTSDITVTDNQTIVLRSDLTSTVYQDLTETVHENASTTIDGNQKVHVKKELKYDVDDKTRLTSGDDLLIIGKKKAVIDIKDQLTLKCGKASITMKKNGDIVISGKKIQLKGTGNIILKGQKILEN